MNVLQHCRWFGGFAVGASALVGQTVVANYTFDGNSFASIDADTTTTASNLGLGSGLQFGFVDATGNPGPGFDVFTYYTNGSQADALANAAYYTFTLTPGAQPLQLVNLRFDAFHISNGPAAFVSTYDLYSSQDSFSATLGTSSLNTWWGPVVTQTFDLTGFAPLTGATEFRIYLASNSTVTNDNEYIDNVVLTAVPEPSVSGVIAGAAALLVGLMKRPRRERGPSTAM